ncbi:hypothetical protein ABIE53_005183 [Burkholderia sp. OAS925]
MICFSIDPFARRVHVAHQPHVDHFERVEPEVAQIVLHAALQILRLLRRQPRAVAAAHRAQLRDDHEIGGIRMQRLANELVGDMRAIKIAGVDVIHALRHRLAQHGKRGVAILRRAEHARSRELHCAIAHAPDLAAGERKGIGDFEVRHQALLAGS